MGDGDGEEAAATVIWTLMPVLQCLPQMKNLLPEAGRGTTAVPAVKGGCTGFLDVHEAKFDSKTSVTSWFPANRKAECRKINQKKIK